MHCTCIYTPIGESFCSRTCWQYRDTFNHWYISPNCKLHRNWCSILLRRKLSAALFLPWLNFDICYWNCRCINCGFLDVIFQEETLSIFKQTTQSDFYLNVTVKSLDTTEIHTNNQNRYDVIDIICENKAQKLTEIFCLGNMPTFLWDLPLFFYLSLCSTGSRGR